MAMGHGHLFGGRQCGMTLIEQIMVLVIVAVLTGLTVPPMHHLLSRNQVRVAQTDFIVALQQARETAVVSGRQTLFCPTRDGESCSNDWRWDGGWLLGHDSDGDHQPDNGPLYVGQGYDGKVTIHSSVGRRYVRYHPDGSASGSNLTLLFCRHGNTADALSVVVSNSGRVRGAPASKSQAAECAGME
ncbi:MAG: GspH/FimT family pseudopilin [Rhodanobacter sp.]|jgi:type IV fimbrial biogenesis protein FimT|nr:GspH/FimT family pseudopilin [Rhodanobacter sp.]